MKRLDNDIVNENATTNQNNTMKMVSVASVMATHLKRALCQVSRPAMGLKRASFALMSLLTSSGLTSALRL